MVNGQRESRERIHLNRWEVTDDKQVQGRPTLGGEGLDLASERHLQDQTPPVEE